ncbi:ABC transporter permease subunit [Microbacterium sp. YY-03]|uniref:ABC transporter permease subunit n=1 Tax=Microbacterium sp. YY-03 TaxID=3421636 RepID=UPI003D187087
MVLFGFLLAGLVIVAPSLSTAASAAPVSAATATCDPPDEQEETDWRFSGFIKFNDEPLPCVTVTIEGNGFSATTVTNDKGRWELFVPEKAEYTLTVDESTLPEGVIVEGESASQTVTFDLTGKKTVNLFLGEGVRETTSFSEQLMNSLFRGVVFGLMLALASMGAALIYGTTGLSNFAHGEMVSWGAIVMMIISTIWDAPLWIGITAAVLAGVGLGFALDAGLWRPLRRKGLGIVQLLVVSIGLAIALRSFYQILIKGNVYEVPGQNVSEFPLGPIKTTYINLIIAGVSIVVILGVAFFLTSTRLGKATRAISDNPSLAAASGINVESVVRLVWMLAGGLAALGGVLWAYYLRGVKFDMGTSMLLLIFAAITLGGLGTAFGALIGSVIIGIVVEVSPLFIPSDLKFAGALLALILILLVRPQGLLGRKERLG